MKCENCGVSVCIRSSVCQNCGVKWWDHPRGGAKSDCNCKKCKNIPRCYVCGKGKIVNNECTNCKVCFISMTQPNQKV